MKYNNELRADARAKANVKLTARKEGRAKKGGKAKPAKGAKKAAPTRKGKAADGRPSTDATEPSIDIRIDEYTMTRFVNTMKKPAKAKAKTQCTSTALSAQPGEAPGMADRGRVQVRKLPRLRPGYTTLRCPFALRAWVAF